MSQIPLTPNIGTPWLERRPGTPVMVLKVSNSPHSGKHGIVRKTISDVSLVELEDGVFDIFEGWTLKYD